MTSPEEMTNPEDRLPEDTPKDKEDTPATAETAPEAPAAETPAESADRSGDIQYGDLSMHLAFQQQLAELLEQADITEEQRQAFLIAASCPCCGAGGLSLSLKIKSDSTPRF